MDQPPPEKDIKSVLDKLQKASLQPKPHAFWNTQPVPQLEEELPTDFSGPIVKDCKVEDVRKDPYPLPEHFEWVTLDVTDNSTMNELYELLRDNYVEDDDNMFRFDYSQKFLRWALCPPGYKRDWHVGVRTSAGRLVAFISAVALDMVVHGCEPFRMAEVNFLCVHKKLRSKRLAPVLIKEITRRVNLKEIWQAIYTSGTLLTKPVAVCAYWHRPLEIEKLVETRFTGLKPRMTMSMAQKLYRVPENWTVTGIRVAKPPDLPQMIELLEAEFKKSRKLYPMFTSNDAAHYLLPKKDVLWVYVREVEGKVTDMFGFYYLPSTVVFPSKHDKIKAAYSFYIAGSTMSTAELVTQCLVGAKKAGMDVFNTLDLGGIGDVVEELKFGRGDGSLRFYIYNYKCPAINPEEVGLVML